MSRTVTKGGRRGENPLGKIFTLLEKCVGAIDVKYMLSM